jgi:hypothetical protein
MARFITAQRRFTVVALGVVVAVAAVGCSMPPAPVATVARVGADSNGAPYSCYFADGNTADRVVGGRTFHWCGPVPRAVQ